jgi:hypothetical protein
MEFKGTVSRDFRPSFFTYGFEFTEKFDSEIAKIGFRGLIETVDADSAASLKPRKQTISNEYLEFLRKKALNETVEAVSAVSLRLLNPLLRSY